MGFMLQNIFLAVSFILIMCPAIQDFGLWLYEGGTPDLGTTGTGRTASARNASTAGVNAAAACRINEYLSLDGDVSLVVSKYQAKASARNLNPGRSDGQLEFDDFDAGYGAKTGLLIEPKAGTVSASYIDLRWTWSIKTNRTWTISDRC